MSYSSSRGFRSPRGIRGSFRSRGNTFRGRGRGSDNYYGSNRGSYSGSNRISYSGSRGSYINSSSYGGRDSTYESGSSSSRYSGDRYSSSHHSRREDGGSHHHKEIRESASGSYGRGHSRHDGEPERKRMRSEIGSSYKEGISPRRSYDDLDHSNRSYSSTGSPYRSSESSSYAKSHHHRTKEYSEFKKPLPPSQDSSYSGSSTRGSRGRGIVRSVTTSRISRSTLPSYLRRSAVGRISRLRPTTSRMQLLLRRKKQIRLMRFRRANEVRGRLSSKNDRIEESTGNTSDDDLLEAMDAEEEELAAEELDQSISKSESSAKGESGSAEDGKSEAKKSTTVKKPKSDALSESESSKAKKDERPPMSTFHKDHITLKCVHCKIESPTFKRYIMHLTSYRHKASMESLLYDLKQKLRRMRSEQRDQQRVIDEQNDDFAKTSYCRLCKLNYKQSKQEHFTSDHHINLNEFLNPRCTVCRLSFASPILYEHHKCTLNHIKRKAFLEKKGVDVKDPDNEDENNDEDSFMVLDSVGSADEDSGDEAPANVTGGDDDTAHSKPKTVPAKKKKLPKVVGAEFIKRVPVYYCKLCRLCLPYNPNTNQEDLLLAHCRGRFHLKRYSIEKSRKTREDATKVKKTKLNKTTLSNGSVPEDKGTEASDSFWDEGGENQKSSDEEEEASDRYDRFGHSENIENSSISVKSEPLETDGANEKVASQA